MRLEDLIGRRVLDLRGRSIGHLTEIAAEDRGSELVVIAYLIGTWGVIERLAMQHIFPRARGYRARWDQLDLSDLEHPRLNCPTSELELEPRPTRRRGARRALAIL